MQNQTLQDLIENLPPDLCQKIMQTNDVSELVNLKKFYLKYPDTLTVIDARIQNLTHLV